MSSVAGIALGIAVAAIILLLVIWVIRAATHAVNVSEEEYRREVERNDHTWA